MMIVACGGDEETTTPIEDDKMVTNGDKIDNGTETPIDPPPEPARTYYSGTLTGHTDKFYTVAFRPDGSTLASGSDDNTIHMWDVSE